MSEARESALAQIAALAQRHGLSAEDIVQALRQATTAEPQARSSGILARVLAWLGGIFILAGIAIFIGVQWDQFSPSARVLVTLGVGFAIYLFALVTTTDERFARVATPMFLIAALLQPAGILVMLDEYARGGKPEHGLLFMCTVMFIQQLLTFMAKRRAELLFTSLFFGAAGFGTLCDILGIEYPLVGTVLGITLMSVSYTADSGPHKAITPFWYLAGSVFFLTGAFDWVEDTPLEITFFGVAAAVMYLGTVLGSRTLLFVSVIALTSFTGYFFRDSLFNAFGLIVIGFVLIALSALAMKLSRRYITRQ
ncbi:MAG: DUF2157 domain-containing protein [Xanthomonadales bacterium]|nr:DUF2157 domain-containing protein [Xanthomonadales bacterium]